MAIKRFDKTEQLAVGVGTAALTFTTATTGNRTYAAAGAEEGDQFWARIQHETLPAEWELSLVTIVGGTIVRSTPVESSTGAAVAFSAGNKIVSDGVPFIRIPTADIDGMDADEVAPEDVVSVFRPGEQRWRAFKLASIATSRVAIKALEYYRAKMAAGETVNIACYGDSWTDGNGTTSWTANPTSGGNAVGNSDHAATAPNAWPAKQQTLLRDMYGNNNINVWNAGYSGKKIIDGWALANYPAAVLNNPYYGTPHLCYVAFGLNDIDGTGSSYETFRTKLIELVNRIAADGTVPILLTCGPHYKNAASGRTNLESSREIDLIKYEVAESLDIPICDIAADMKEWLSVNRDGYRWGALQTDRLHFGNAGHAFMAAAIARWFFRDIVEIVPGAFRRLNVMDSCAATTVTDSGTYYTPSNLYQGANAFLTSGYTAEQVMMTAWVWNRSPKTELIYRGIASEGYNGGASGTAPRVRVKEWIGSTTLYDKEPMAAGYVNEAGGSYRKSDLPYRVGPLPFGLTKVEFLAGDLTTNLFFGNFEFWQTEPGITLADALKHTGPFRRAFASSGIQYAVVPEALDGSNIFGLMGSDQVNIYVDVELPPGAGLIYAHTHGYDGSAGYGTQLVSLLFRQANDTLTAHVGKGATDGSIVTPSALATSAALPWINNRMKFWINIQRSGDDQITTIYDATNLAAGALLTITRTLSDQVLHFAGAVGGLIWNATIAGGAGSAVIHELQVDRSGQNVTSYRDRPPIFGYSKGGTVTQGTSKSTTVVLHQPAGRITMHNATLNAGASVSFTLTNRQIAATDFLSIKHESGGTLGVYRVEAVEAAGSATITITNISGSNLSEAIVLKFFVASLKMA